MRLVPRTSWLAWIIDEAALVPYIDTLRWVFIAVALIGIAVAIHAMVDDWKRGQR